MQDMSVFKRYFLSSGIFLISNIAFYYLFKQIIKSMDIFSERKAQMKKKSNNILLKFQEEFGVSGKELNLNEYERDIITEVVLNKDINTTFDMIGGLENIISELRETVILPFNYPELFVSSKILQGLPKGVLLYGPPGCGKTMIAKALAYHSNATFINMHISTLTDKWFGESNRLVAALFSLAKKLEPTIIFIDEIDSFLGKRQKMDHEATSMVKAEFMSFWDGFSTDENSRIVILGATNRPNDIDEAVLRRMSKRFFIPLPNAFQREKLLKLFLSDIKLAPDFDFNFLVLKTDGFSGSDIKELCRESVMSPVREFISLNIGFNKKNLDNMQVKDIGKQIRALETRDFDTYLHSYNEFRNNSDFYNSVDLD
ncbi:uncharacterized protein T551_02253 [Pneumocystis jirovecii RU7]|uniref:AAA+ ATPase domain-containing protein n=1 Tax=Pneumocystis jirovecii (strain RU7) TaxID=1408657 RepID=A0A0W4ZMN4_PNEJ7|nr:uncharacterized protein T551_02253 [Pneumocystis jirovecii RU7]KTW29637.1 hypothetical protein T551_02253 [Pneumocystis jirovecii RU7]